MKNYPKINEEIHPGTKEELLTIITSQSSTGHVGKLGIAKGSEKYFQVLKWMEDGKLEEEIIDWAIIQRAKIDEDFSAGNPIVA